ncbi:hypothetical protein [Nesterenkonia alkaliphila]|uniref:DUF4352 domain-containing protein n=1 Tax=Nesterenkonia alkaliphila TaxID=1463631 RepID=A0A7K1ULC0_9MICC|nr:hypothetical protein [Nesterenkonia alkaliphila]MVT27287.1 hypothetical protein [Nesterenkonia alkaliphila]GFZ82317.1 hypothetical protein GCM10011359_08790 [Nesterenkonia alkaliphila]
MNSQAQPQGSFDSSGQWQPGFHDAQGNWHGGFYDEHSQWQPGFYGPGNQWHGGFYDGAGSWHAGYRTPEGSWVTAQAAPPAAPPAEVPQAGSGVLPTGEQPTQAIPAAAAYSTGEQPTEAVPPLSQEAGAYAYPPEGEQAEEEETKGKGGVFALVAFLLVLLGGGAAAGWWFFLREDDEEPEPEATEEASEEPTEEATAEPEAESTAAPEAEGTDQEPLDEEAAENAPDEEPTPEEEDPATEAEEELTFNRNPADMEITSAQTFNIPNASIGSDSAPVTYTMNRAKLTENHQNGWDLWGLESNGSAPEGHIWLVVDMSIEMPQNQSISFNGGTWTLTATDQNGVSDEHVYHSTAGDIGEWPAGSYGALIAVPEDAEEIALDAELEIFYGGSGTTTVTSTEPIILDFPLAD